jgi:hypothetical protein
LARLRRYMEAYNIKFPGAVEKDDLVNTIIAARVRLVSQTDCTLFTFLTKYSLNFQGQDGCLSPVQEVIFPRDSFHSP